MRALTGPVQRLMDEAERAAKSAGRAALMPPDIFRALLDMPDGFHLRILVDELGLDLDALRTAASKWEPAADLEQDWKCVILKAASAEAKTALKPYINTEHVLLALLQLWPKAPCSKAILDAAGGEIDSVRSVASTGWSA